MKKRFAVLIVSLLLAINIPVLLLLSNALVQVFDLPYYQQEFSKLGVYEKVPDADVITNNLLSFFSGSVAVQSGIFSQREIAHLYDVKALIGTFQLVLYALLFAQILLLILLFYLSNEKFIRYSSRIIMIGFFLSLLVAASFFVFSDNFDFLFLNFHTTFFTKNTWMFEEGTLLVTLFPEQFFYDAFHYIVGNLVLQSLVIFMVVFIFYKKYSFALMKRKFNRRQTNKNESYLNKLLQNIKSDRYQLRKEVVTLAKKKKKR